MESGWDASKKKAFWSQTITTVRFWLPWLYKFSRLLPSVGSLSSPTESGEYLNQCHAHLFIYLRGILYWFFLFLLSIFLWNFHFFLSLSLFLHDVHINLHRSLQSSLLYGFFLIFCLNSYSLVVSYLCNCVFFPLFSFIERSLVYFVFILQKSGVWIHIISVVFPFLLSSSFIFTNLALKPFCLF